MELSQGHGAKAMELRPWSMYKGHGACTRAMEHVQVYPGMDRCTRAWTGVPGHDYPGMHHPGTPSCTTLGTPALLHVHGGLRAVRRERTVAMVESLMTVTGFPFTIYRIQLTTGY